MAKGYAIYIDRFSSADDTDSRGRYVYKTYKDVKPVVLKAGRFSCFEASERPGIYQQFFSDPELEISDLGYPWHGVKVKV